MENTDPILPSSDFIQTFLPRDRRISLATDVPLPEYATGTCLFADISGFTPLTESLATNLGKQHGAEVLTAILNDIFDKLISQVHDYDGSVISFGGDAITCWFLESHTPLQAVLTCAQEMMGEMAQFAEIHTPDEKSHELSMKIGIAHGAVRRFLAGDSVYGHLDVLVGKTLNRMSAAEHHATKGEIVCAPEIPPLVNDTAMWGESREGFYPLLSLECPVASLHPTSCPSESCSLPPAMLQPYLPPAVFKILSGMPGRFLGELRPVISAFVSFEGVNYDEDPQVEGKLNRYVTTVQRIATHYGGNVVLMSCGDKGSVLHVLFGAPMAHENDEVRAVGWSLDLQNAVQEMSFITGQRIGITRGLVYAGAMGALTRQVYTIIGDEVNISARLMQACQPGQILVSQRVMNAAQRHFTFHNFPGFLVKGIELPIHVATPVAPLPSMYRAASPKPLVGRINELTLLKQVLGEVVAGQGRLVRLMGPAGIGKSRLVEELRQKAQEQVFHILQGECQNVGRGLSYRPWQDIFRQFFNLRSDWSLAQQVNHIEMTLQWIDPTWLPRIPLLGDLLGLDIPDTDTTTAFNARLRQQSLFALVSDLLTRWAERQPVLIIIEDIHWIDEVSAALLEFLSRSLRAVRVLLIITQRPSVDPNQLSLPALNSLMHYRQLNLTELTSEAVRVLVTRRLGGELLSTTLAFIQERAQGNPLFAEKFADALRDTCHLEQIGGQWVLVGSGNISLQLPDTVQDLILARVDSLDAESKLVLKISSVIGRLFEAELVAQVYSKQLKRGILEDRLRDLERHDFILLERLEPQLIYLFRHNTTREAVYGMLLFSHRFDLHQAVGEALEHRSLEETERLAYHYSQAYRYSRSQHYDKSPEQCQEWLRGKAMTYLSAAAAKAQREYANETALKYYEQALDLEKREEWLRGKVEVLHILGQREAERAALESLEAIAKIQSLDTAYLRGQYHEAVAEYDQAQATLERALETCQEQGDIVSRVRCLAQLGLIARRQGSYDKAKRLYILAWDPLRNQNTHSTKEAQALAQVLNGLGTVHRQQGNFGEAQECYELALTLSRKRSDRVDESESLNNLGVAFFYQRRFGEALEYYQQALDIRRDIGDRAGEGEVLGNLAQAVCEMGDYTQARSYSSKALEIYQTVGNRWEEVNTYIDLGIFYQQLGDLSTAQDYLQRGRTLALEIGDEAGEAYILVNLGLVVCYSGDLAAAEKLLTTGLALTQAQDDRYLMSSFFSYLGIVSLRANEPEQALKRANSALIIKQEQEMPLQMADDLATIAAAHLVAGDVAEAMIYARRVMAILDECGGNGPEFPQRDYFICYRVLSVAGQVEEAHAVLQLAHDWVTARAEKITDPALRRSFMENVAQNREIMAAWQA